MELVCIGLGSNLGDRARNLFHAYRLITNNKEVHPLRLSRFYETTPVGIRSQPMFLNAALTLETSLSPHLLLEKCQYIEDCMGRIRTVKWGPRNIDIDILLYGDTIIDNDLLKIPHPLMHTRQFVLRPLAEIGPDIIHPLLKKSILLLYNEL
ncbi:MAG: 2-amino-4-hydroxy-6-hydroxymethyldihydropteridine diphosphokinase [Candidatus Brocadiaceae bacterium]|nr:2-amino-4-hydroxy-6-hydroxymethyldihydropteridine diphosphokinase [Candidatus Brocadiaceae bacterium]